MSARSYWAPMDIATGMPAYQPHGAQTLAAWRLDRNFKHQDTGFLDAPSYLPAGGTRAIDAGRTTLGVAHLPREGAYT